MVDSAKSRLIQPPAEVPAATFGTVMNRILGRLLVSATAGTVVAAGLVPVADASAPVAERAAVRTVTYAGHGRTVHLGSVGRLTGTSSAFRTFVKRELTRLWREVGGTSACKSAPYVTVKRWRSDGFAEISGIGNGSPCPNGGYHAIWVVRNGVWRAPYVLGGQEALWCSDLRAYRVPNAISGGSCYNDLGTYRSYATYRQPRTIGTVAYAGRIVARTVNAVSPTATARWASQAVVDQLYDMHWNDDVLSIVKCFTRTDPEYGPYLGTATRGCVLDAAYYGNGGTVPTYRAHYVLRMRPAPLGRWRVSGMVGHSST